MSLPAETDEIRAAWERVYRAFEPFDDMPREFLDLTRRSSQNRMTSLHQMAADADASPAGAERRDALLALLALLGGAA